MNPIGTWPAVTMLYKAATAWGKRIEKREAQFRAFMKKALFGRGLHEL
jgi:hypothetical protein